MIGLGGFSKVFLGNIIWGVTLLYIWIFFKNIARNNLNMKFYALKVIDKKFIIEN